MTNIKVYWKYGECEAFCDERPGITGSGKDEKAAAGDLAIKLGLITVEVIKKVPVTD